MKDGASTSAASNSRSRAPNELPGSPRGIHHRSISSISMWVSPAFAISSRRPAKPMESRMTARSAVMSPMPEVSRVRHGRNAFRDRHRADLRRPLLGEVSPALVHAVATN